MTSKTADFSSLFNRSQNVIFCGYRDLGLLCLDSSNNHTLTLISTIRPDENDSKAWFTKISTLSLCPAPPSTSLFTQITVNKNGSKVALIGHKIIVIVDVHEDFWAGQLLFEAGNLPTFQEQYFAQCNILHMNLSVGKYPPSVVKACWYFAESELNTQSESLDISTDSHYWFGALYSDSFLRLYNTKKSVERAMLEIDFKGLLCPDASFGNVSLEDRIENEEDAIFGQDSRLGLSTQLVSFDFGPSYLLNIAGEQLNELATILAMDSDGQLYFAAFDFLKLRCFGPSGPHSVLRSNAVSGKFICAASDLLFVRHKFSSILPVFAMSSCEGFISHFVMVEREPLEFLIRTGHNVFDFYFYDVLEIPNVSENNTALALQNDFCERATYLAINRNNAYIVDVSGWITSIYYQISSDTFASNSTVIGGESVNLKESRVLHIFMFVDRDVLDVKKDTDNKENFNIYGKATTSKEANKHKSIKNSTRRCIRSLACFNLPGAKSDYPIQDSEKQFEESKNCAVEQLFVALTADGDSMTSIVRRNFSILFPKDSTISDEKPAKPHRNAEPSYREKVSDLLRTVEQGMPRVKFNGLTRKEELNLCENAVKKLIENTCKKDVAVNFSLEEAQKLLTSFEELEGTRLLLSNRVSNFFAQITSTKSRVTAYQKTYRILEERIKRIAQSMQPIVFPILDNEAEILGFLREYQETIEDYKKELIDTNIQAAALKNKFVTSSAPFQPSAKAQKFMLSKTAGDVDQVKEYAEKLNAKVDLLNERFHFQT